MRLSFSELLQELRVLFSADRVDEAKVKEAMSSYESDPADWMKYAKFDTQRYTRNLVDVGNGQYNILILCWPESLGSPIHDHTDSHCFYKVLDGELRETRFAFPSASADSEKPLTVLSVNDLKANDVGYINDSYGLHRMENLSHTNQAISLHLYIPAFDTCKLFDANTGKSTKCPITFYSVDGTLQPPLARRAAAMK